jgi:hypothetical protein
MPIYDDFSAAQLDTTLWTAVVPGAGFELATLKVELEHGECTLSMSSLKAEAAKAQTVFLSTRTWEVGRDPLDFSTIIAAETAGDGPACAAFGVFDAAGGTVLGIAATGTQLFAVARESGDPLAPLERGALEFSDLGVFTEPLRRHDVKIEYDPQRRIARWYVDEVLRLYREVPFDPREFTCAFGVLPLRAPEPGQPPPALTAVFGPVIYSDESELEPDPFYSAMPG